MAKRRAKRPSHGKKSGKGFTGHIALTVLLKLSVVLGLLFLSRILFYLFNLGYFSNLSFTEALRIFFTGLRFDLSALLVLNTPFIIAFLIPFGFRYNRIYRGIVNGYFYAINIFGLLLNFVDTIYFRFTLKRLTADFFSYVGVGGDFNKLIPQFLKDFWFIGVAWLAFVILLCWLASRFRIGQPAKNPGFGNFLLDTVILVVFSALAVVGIRGGLQLRPINLVTAGNYTSAKNIPLLLNTPFSIIKSFNHEKLKTVHWFRSEKDLARVYNPVHEARTGQFRHLNVMIIIMESFSREHIGSLNRSLENGRYQGYTPFMDSLIHEGLYFDAFANGKTSIQGIPAILSAIPSLMNESFIQSPYAAGKYTGIAGLLKPKGYTSAFFHGGTNGTMGFDSYTKLTGFDHYFGRKEYNNEKDYDGKWGIRDEEFFRFTARKIGGFRQPFVSVLFSLSSHHPYYVPSKYVNIFRTGKLPIQQSIMYADYSLAEFFHTIKHAPWYSNTLFIITADHTSEGYYPYYQSDIGQYSIPLLFYMPGSNLKGTGKGIAQQTDIMPTVLNYLGYDRGYLAFGNDLLDSALTGKRFSVHYISGLYGMVKDGYYMEHNGTAVTSLFDLEKDPLLKNNIAARKGPEQEKLVNFFKAYLQQYNNRLIENRLIIE